MDFLNKSLAQVSDLFRSMTPGARLTAGLLLAVVVASIGYLFRETTGGPDAFLFGGAALSDGQLTRIEAAIAAAQLNGAVREGNRIRVPAGQQSAYLAAVADGDALPPDFNTILEKAIGSGGPWESREQTRERLKIAKQQTLSEILRAMYWVESAVVLYDERDSRDLRSISVGRQISASVSLRPVAGETLSAVRIKNIQKLVAGAVNMPAENVVVSNLGQGGLYGSDSEITPDIFPEGSLMHTKVAFEAQKRDSITKALRDIPGVRVEVNADFDSTYEDTTRTIKPDPKTATQSESTTEERSIQSSPDNGGRPGLTSQGPNRNTAAQAAPSANQNETTNKTSQTVNSVGLTENQILKKGYTPKEVKASVTIPSNYVETLWKKANPTATDPPKPDDLTLIKNQVVTNVEEIVEPLLALEANKGQNQYKHVHVVVLDSLPAAEIAPPSFASTASSWVSRYWNTLAMLGMAMFSLMVLRSVVKGKPGDAASAAAMPSGGLSLESEPTAARSSAAAEEPQAERPRLKLKKGPSMKDDLIDVVRDDPDAAADILRSWITKAG